MCAADGQECRAGKRLSSSRISGIEAYGILSVPALPSNSGFPRGDDISDHHESGAAASARIKIVEEMKCRWFQAAGLYARVGRPPESDPSLESRFAQHPGQSVHRRNGRFRLLHLLRFAPSHHLPVFQNSSVPSAICARPRLFPSGNVAWAAWYGPT